MENKVSLSFLLFLNRPFILLSHVVFAYWKFTFLQMQSKEMQNTRVLFCSFFQRGRVCVCACVCLWIHKLFLARQLTHSFGILQLSELVHQHIQYKTHIVVIIVAFCLCLNDRFSQCVQLMKSDYTLGYARSWYVRLFCLNDVQYALVIVRFRVKLCRCVIWHWKSSFRWEQVMYFFEFLFCFALFTNRQTGNILRRQQRRNKIYTYVHIFYYICNFDSILAPKTFG